MFILDYLKIRFFDFIAWFVYLYYRYINTKVRSFNYIVKCEVSVDHNEASAYQYNKPSVRMGTRKVRLDRYVVALEFRKKLLTLGLNKDNKGKRFGQIFVNHKYVGFHLTYNDYDIPRLRMIVKLIDHRLGIKKYTRVKLQSKSWILVFKEIIFFWRPKKICINPIIKRWLIWKWVA